MRVYLIAFTPDYEGIRKVDVLWVNIYKISLNPPWLSGYLSWVSKIYVGMYKISKALMEDCFEGFTVHFY